MLARRVAILALNCVILSHLAAGRAAAQSPPDSSWLFREDSWLFSDEPLLPGLKNQDLVEGWKYSAGAEFRHRYMDERNRLRPLGETARDTYHLYRFAPWVELQHELVTLYVQGIDAENFEERLPPVAIDVNRTDLLQYYFDLNLLDLEEGGQLRLKGGRQFLLYGSQHLVSPLAWANTYRNFEGLKLSYTDEFWTVDGFVVKPVNGAASFLQFHPYSRDEWDASQTFSGVYATYKKLPHGTLDLYWLWLAEERDLPTRLEGNRHTIGARLAGKQPFFSEEASLQGVLLTWDLEGAYQFGRDRVFSGTKLDVSAGFVSLLGGFEFTELPWTPGLGGIFYWGSGDHDPTDGTNGTFTTLFPLGHAYWGQIDNFSGANLQDFGAQATLKPTKRLTLNAQYHFFNKDQATDAIWNIAGAPLGNLVTPETDVGQELDLVATMQFNKNLQVQAGYFWFWYGEAVSRNAGIAPREDAQQFYVMTTWQF